MIFTHSVVKNRSTNHIVAKFVKPDHAKAYCESLNKNAQKRQFHWFETTGQI